MTEAASRPRRASFTVLAATLVALFLGADAPTPLYVVYQDRYGFSTAVLTLVFGVYVVGQLGRAG